MKIRAVIFDVYGTLLQVGSSPLDAKTRWQTLYQDSFGTSPGLDQLQFSVACNQAVARLHAEARSRGIQYPEILWPGIVNEVLPEFSQLDPHAQEEFVMRQIQLGRTLSLHPGASDTLRWLRENGCLLGIASNAQAYSIRELRELLAGGGLHFDLFDPDLCFWSFEHGFSKPDPHVFRILSTRLEARGISTIESIVVGDRIDNDIIPAKTQGFGTWHITTTPDAGREAGDWRQLDAFLSRA